MMYKCHSMIIISYLCVIIIIFICIARVVIDPASTSPVQTPEMIMVERTAADEALVTFSPRSLGDFSVRYYTTNDSSPPDLDQVCVHFCIEIA